MRYSNDFRIKVVNAITVLNNTKLSVSKMFKISRDTIDSWLSLEKTGSLFKEPTWSKPKAIPVNVFEEYINDKANQSKFLKEMAKDLNVSATAIHRVKTKLNITRKKNKNPSKKQMKTKENNSL